MKELNKLLESLKHVPEEVIVDEKIVIGSKVILFKENQSILYDNKIEKIIREEIPLIVTTVSDVACEVYVPILGNVFWSKKCLKLRE